MCACRSRSSSRCASARVVRHRSSVRYRDSSAWGVRSASWDAAVLGRGRGGMGFRRNRSGSGRSDRCFALGGGGGEAGLLRCGCVGSHCLSVFVSSREVLREESEKNGERALGLFGSMTSLLRTGPMHLVLEVCARSTSVNGSRERKEDDARRKERSESAAHRLSDDTK